jgi:hypothetical protein
MIMPMATASSHCSDPFKNGIMLAAIAAQPKNGAIIQDPLSINICVDCPARTTTIRQDSFASPGHCLSTLRRFH